MIQRSSSPIYQNLDLPQIEAIVAEIEREKEAGEFTVDLTTISTASKPMFRGGKEAQQAGCNSCGPSSNVTTDRRVWTVITFVFFNERLLLCQDGETPFRGKSWIQPRTKECEDHK